MEGKPLKECDCQDGMHSISVPEENEGEEDVI